MNDLNCITDFMVEDRRASPSMLLIQGRSKKAHDVIICVQVTEKLSVSMLWQKHSRQKGLCSP